MEVKMKNYLEYIKIPIPKYASERKIKKKKGK